MKVIKKFGKSVSDIVFPICCVCCGESTSDEERLICSWCEEERFEQVRVDDREILPETVLGLYSMWYFDKGGYLQQLLHNLKYHFLKKAGVEMGTILGRTIITRNTPELQGYFRHAQPILIPVPLHKSRLRKRGYNQAEALAEGIVRVTKWDLLEKGVVIRSKKTRTQTGFNSSERAKNIKNAFRINDYERIQNRLPVIVDDVFTTGATTFELAELIYNETSERSLIVTVAKA